MYTTDDLVTSVKIRGMFPDVSEGSLSPESILLVATEELHSSIIPLVLSVREKYYETFYDQPMVSGIDTYKLPERSIGSMVSCVQYILNQQVKALNPIDPVNQVSTNTGLYPKAFWFQNDSIVVYPEPNSTQGVIRMRYSQRPSVLTGTIKCAQISAVDQPNGTVTISRIPTGWVSSTKLDFVDGKLPFTAYAIEKEATSVTGFDVSFASLPLEQDGVTARVKKGDWLCPAGYTCLPEVLNEFFPMLAQSTAVKLLEATGANEHLPAAIAKLKAYGENAIRLITPRDQWGLKKVCSNWRNW